MGDHGYRINDSFASDTQEKLIPDDVQEPSASRWKFWKKNNKPKENPPQPSDINKRATNQKRSDLSKKAGNQPNKSDPNLKSSSSPTNADEKTMQVEKVKQYLKGLQSVESKSNEPLTNGVLIEEKNTIVALTFSNGLKIIKLAKIEDNFNSSQTNESSGILEGSNRRSIESDNYKEKQISFEKINKNIWEHIGTTFTLKNRVEFIVLFLSAGQKCQEILNCEQILKLYTDLDRFIKAQDEFPDLQINHLANIDEVVTKDNKIEFCLLYDPDNSKAKVTTAPKKSTKVLTFQISEHFNSYSFTLKAFEKSLKFTPKKLKFSSKGKHILILGKTKSTSKVSSESIIKLVHTDSNNSCSHCNLFTVDHHATSFMLIDGTFILVVSSKSGSLFFHDIRVQERKFLIEAHNFSVSKVLFWENKIISLSLDKKAIMTSIPNEINKLKVFKGFAYSMCLKGSENCLFIRTANMESLGEEEEKDSMLSVSRIDKIKALNLENFEKIKIKKAKSKSEFFTLVSNEKKTDVQSTKEAKTRLKSLLYVPPSIDQEIKESLIFDSFNFVYKIEIDENGSGILLSERKNKPQFYHSIVSIGKFIIGAGFEMKYEMFDISSKLTKCENSLLENKHNDAISLLIKHSAPDGLDYLISGSKNGTIAVFRIEDINKELAFQVLKSHSLQITALSVLNDKIWSASKDNTIKVWSSIEALKGNNEESIKLVYTIQGINGIVYFMTPHCGKYVLTCTLFGKLQCYSSVTYTPIFSTIIFGPVRSFLAYDKKFVYSNADNIFEQNLDIERTSDQGDAEISLIGPEESQMYQAAHYYNLILSKQSFEFQPEFDKWVILPYLYTPLHLYAHHNLPKFIEQSFMNNNSLIESTDKKSALSIAVSKDNEDCVMVIIKYLKFKAESNPYLIDFLRNSDLIKLNSNGRSSLSLFYQILLTKVTAGNPPRFANYQSELPIYKTDENVVINYKEVFSEIYPAKINPVPGKNSESNSVREKPSEIDPLNINPVPGKNSLSNNAIETGKSIVFLRSLIKITHDMGSERSLQVLKSFVECKNLEIFQTPFVQAYIEHKFSTTLTFMRIEFIIYLLYMFLLCTTLILDSYTNIFMTLVLSSGFLVTLVEIIRIISYGSSYFFDMRNIINGIRAILFYFFIGFAWNCLENNRSLHDIDGINYPLLLLFLLSFMKGLTFFQLFEHTRYFLALLKRIFFDSISFLSFLTYFVVVTALVLLMASNYTRGIPESFESGYSIVTGGLDPVGSEFNVPEWLIFIVAVVLMTWIMMNLLVAIFNNSFNIVYNTNDMYNYSVMAWMAYEVEMVIHLLNKVLSYFKNTATFKGSKKYLYVCQNGNWKDESDAIIKRIHKTKILIKDSIKKVNAVCTESSKVKRLSKKIFKKTSKKHHKSRNREEELMSIFNFLVHTTHNKGLMEHSDGSKALLELLKDLE